jgi:HPt (histidine-containing phosphotransfer) domain-containing protein
MNDYVSKPIRIETLVDALSKVRSHVEQDDDGHAVEQDHGAEPAAPDSAPPGDPVIDAAAIQNLFDITGGDPGFMAEMIDSYLDTSPPLLERMRVATETGDADALRMAAHTLKSGSADFGAMQLSQICARLEELGKRAEWDGAAALYEQAHDHYPAVREALLAVRERQEWEG